MLPGVGLQHRRQEAVGEGEAGEPEEGGRGYSRRPAAKLLHTLAQVPGPGGQRLQRGVRLVVGGRHSTVTGDGSLRHRQEEVTAQLAWADVCVWYLLPQRWDLTVEDAVEGLLQAG